MNLPALAMLPWAAVTLGRISGATSLRTTPAFDGAGNLYMTPLLPHEPILMISLDPTTGARRFVVPLEEGQRGGGRRAGGAARPGDGRGALASSPILIGLESQKRLCRRRLRRIALVPPCN